ncbi:hypothetical protein B0F90DRAFT_343429 [Multifurca ochricompacta]|uniref:Uncharacterized protein n=1 Tax=Multifurca ochricompacta TaxID=376703 RepID=A0AAD4QMB5_9AGAM|nr:hypothetical protein B0F90DRAFT_343429 [Multifurca ochricompacta]
MVPSPKKDATITLPYYYFRWGGGGGVIWATGVRWRTLCGAQSCIYDRTYHAPIHNSSSGLSSMWMWCSRANLSVAEISCGLLHLATRNAKCCIGERSARSQSVIILDKMNKVLGGASFRYFVPLFSLNEIFSLPFPLLIRTSARPSTPLGKKQNKTKKKKASITCHLYAK